MSLTRRSPSPPPLDGEIRFDDRARAAAAEDFGHLVHHTPEGVVLPASDEDVAAAVRWAAERLAALYAAMVELLERHLHLALGAETGSRRFATGAYGFWHAHVRALVVDAGGEPVAGQSRLDALVDALLAPLAPELYQHQRDRGRSAADVTAALTHLARAALGRPDGDRGTA